MKILIISKDNIRDLLMVTPVIRAFKTELNANTYMLINENAEVLFDNPYLDQHYSYAQLKDLRGIMFDYIVDLKNTAQTKILRSKLNGKKITYKSSSMLEWFQTKLKINQNSAKKHIVDQYFELLEPVGIKASNLGIDFYFPEKDEVENSWLPETHRNGYAAVAISGAYNTRKLPTERLIELCDRINKPIVLIGDEQDQTVAEQVELFFQRGTDAEEEAIEKLNKKAIIFNACGKFNFNQSASLIKNASWVFSYDNDMMHIASAFKKKIFSIWGNTTANDGYYPYRTNFIIFENIKLHCRPCSKKGFDSCPKGHFKCMNDVIFDFYLPD